MSDTGDSDKKDEPPKSTFSAQIWFDNPQPSGSRTVDDFTPTLRSSLSEPDLTAHNNFKSDARKSPKLLHRTSPVPAVFGPDLPPTLTQFTPRTHVKDANAVRGVCGLRNLGNTCFMNSGLQCLLGNSSLVSYFSSVFHTNDTVQETLTGKFSTVLSLVWSGKYSLIHPSQFKQTLGFYHPQFKDYRQHDCQEFLALLLDTLHEQLNEANVTKLIDPAPLSGAANDPLYLSDTETLKSISSFDTESTLRSPHSPSEDSNQSEISIDRNNALHRMKPIPDHLKLSQDEAVIEPAKTPVADDSATSGLLSDACNNVSPPTRNIMDTQTRNDLEADQRQSNASQNNNDMEVETGSNEQTNILQAVDQESSSLRENNQDSVEFSITGNKNSRTTTGVDLNSAQNGNKTAIFDSSNESKTFDGSCSDENNRRMPTFEDLCMKDTKTLNVNMLAEEFMVDEVTTDSEKYHKPENTDQRNIDQLTLDTSSNSMFEMVANKGDSFKPLKETNLLANQKEKFADDCYSKKFLLSDLDDTSYDINNIKRIKIDEQEKNIKMQHKLKVNVERNTDDGVSQEFDVLKSTSATCTQSTAVTQTGTRSKSDPLTTHLPVFTSRSDHHLVSGPSNIRPTSVNSLMNNEDHMLARYNREADRSWGCYLARNKSVIVDTFQGQFKSTVVCSECHHISVTFEPFMYLSVPLPHVMELQTSVVFVPCDNKKPVRYLVTVNKFDKVKAIKSELLRVLGEEDTCDVVLAEVLGKHISKILEDTTLLRYLNQSTRQIYAFEMLPPPQIEDEQKSSDTPDLVGDICMTPNNEVPATKSIASSDVLNNSFNSADGAQLPGAKSPSSDVLNNSFTSTAAGRGQNFKSGDINWRENILSEAGGGAECEGGLDLSGGNKEQDGVASEEVATDQWKTCAICLEEMVDSALMVHAICGGTLCHACLEMSFKHYGNESFVCPVCSSPVNPCDDFVQLSAMADYKPKTRILVVPVLHRLDSTTADKSEKKLWGHPNVLYLPSNLSGEFLYECVDRVVNVLSSYTILLTDGQGLHCSRCMYTSHCSGCEISRTEPQLSLQPNDHLTVRLTSVGEDQDSQIRDHSSMDGLRSRDHINLYDCFKAFTESETLDEHNPWYCPQCCRNQCAKKTMTVWRYPDTLVVYLKRFVFQDLMSTKIDNKVVFPLENLDLQDYISGPIRDELTYDLQSFICHFGGVSSGHYTAYCKHAEKDKWFYYNDETSTLQAPPDDSYKHGYVLFYQRQGTTNKINLPLNLDNKYENDHHNSPGTLSPVTMDTTPSRTLPTDPSSSSTPAMEKFIHDLQRIDNRELTPRKDTSMAYDFYS